MTKWKFNKEWEEKVREIASEEAKKLIDKAIENLEWRRKTRDENKTMLNR